MFACLRQLSSYAHRTGQPLPFPEHHLAHRYTGAAAAPPRQGYGEQASSSTDPPRIVIDDDEQATHSVYDMTRTILGVMRQMGLTRPNTTNAGADLPSTRISGKRRATDEEADYTCMHVENLLHEVLINDAK